MAPRAKRQKLTSLSDIYKFFRHNQTPIYFLSPTPYNILGLGRWINKFEYINFFDAFDGTHPKITVPREHGPHEFRSIEDVNNYLLRHKEVRARIAERGPGLLLLVMFDEETEQLVRELGLKIALPPARRSSALISSCKPPMAIAAAPLSSSSRRPTGRRTRTFSSRKSSRSCGG